jgi:hypothetical protein
MSTISNVCIALLLLASSRSNAADQEFVKACESAIASRLLSPPSYRRISISENSAKADISDLFNTADFLLSTERKAALESLTNGTLEGLHTKLTIDYYAKNVYGVDLRGKSSCDYVTLNGFGKRFEPLAMQINMKLDPY